MPERLTCADNFFERVDYAAKTIAAGRDTSCNRTFFNCFEMNDADAVVLALVGRAQDRPSGRLAANLWAHVSKSVAESALTQYPGILSKRGAARQSALKQLAQRLRAREAR